MDWTIVIVIVLAVLVAVPLLLMQRKTAGGHSKRPETLESPAEPGSEGMSVPAAGDVAPGPDEPAR
jgi:hypothetical protein